MQHEVTKKWGTEVWLENDKTYCVKLLFLKEGFQSSLHFHPIKRETFTCVAGKVRLEVMPHYKQSPDYHDIVHRVFLQPYQHYTLEPGIPHRFTPITGEAVIVETSSFHSDEDVVRLEESRKIE